MNKRHWGKDLLDGGSGENTGEEAFDLLPSSNFQQCSSLKFFLYPHPQLANPWIHHIFPLFKSVIFLQLFISTHEGWWQTRRGDKRLWWLHGFCHNASFQPLHYPPHRALYTLHSTLYTLHSTFYNLNSTLYTATCTTFWPFLNIREQYTLLNSRRSKANSMMLKTGNSLQSVTHSTEHSTGVTQHCETMWVGSCARERGWDGLRDENGPTSKTKHC